MIKICVTLNEGQSQNNEFGVHSHVWGSHSAKFDDDELKNSEESLGGRDTQTDAHVDTAPCVLTFSKSLWLWKQKEERKFARPITGRSVFKFVLCWALVLLFNIMKSLSYVPRPVKLISLHRVIYSVIFVLGVSVFARSIFIFPRQKTKKTKNNKKGREKKRKIMRSVEAV